MIRGPLTAAVALFVAAWFLAARAENTMRKVFSQFWQERQPHMREALKKAHAEARRQTGGA